MIDTIGAADQVAERYYEVNLSAELADDDNSLPEMSSHIVSAIANPLARIADARVTDAAGQSVTTIGAGEPINVEATVEVEPELQEGALRVTDRRPRRPHRLLERAHATRCAAATSHGH